MGDLSADLTGLAHEATSTIRGRSYGHAVGVAIAVLLLGSPALFTHDGFMSDYTNHLWLVWVQENAISQHLQPTYFLSAPFVGVFYPLFEFYGGTLYAGAGALAALLGGRIVVAYTATMLLSVAAAYGGLLWLARQFGVRSWQAHAPAVVFVSSAYYVTNLYGRGEWPELVATSMIPLLIASGYRLARAPRVPLGSAVLFVASSVLFVGSHNVTLLLGSGALIVVGGALWLALGLRPRDIDLRRATTMACLFLLAVGVNAWFLLPNLVHASDVAIGSQRPMAWNDKSSVIFNSPGVLLNPLRSVPRASTTPGLFVQAPDWFLVWILASAATLWAGTGRRLRRAGVALATALLALLALMMIGPLWDAAPRLLREVQFPYRLSTYVALCTAGLVLVGTLAVQHAADRQTRRRAMSLALAGAMTISVALCTWQLWVPTTDGAVSYHNRDGVFVSTHVTPRTWYDTSYVDASAPVFYTGDRLLAIDPSTITGDHMTLTVTPPPGTAPFATNIAGGPYAVRISGGIVRVGRTPTGLTVARRRGTVSGPVRVTFSRAGGALPVGRAVSLLSLVSLLCLLAAGVYRRCRPHPFLHRRSLAGDAAPDPSRSTAAERSS